MLNVLWAKKRAKFVFSHRRESVKESKDQGLVMMGETGRKGEEIEEEMNEVTKKGQTQKSEGGREIEIERGRDG